MLSSVCFMSRLQAERLTGRPTQAVISITSPRQAPAALHKGFHSIFRIAFEDVIAPCVKAMPATAADAERIRRFVAALTATPNPIDLVVHCEGGVSRSAAVAFWVSQAYGLPLAGYYDAANPHVVELLQPGLSSHLKPILIGKN